MATTATTTEPLLAAFLPPQQAAAELGVCKRTLDRWRKLGRGPSSDQARAACALSQVKLGGVPARARAAHIGGCPYSIVVEGAAMSGNVDPNVSAASHPP